jgi:hypothetical protein
MAKNNIDIGTAGNPATGDSLRSAFAKVNATFDDIYTAIGDPSTGLYTTALTNGDVKLQPNGVGVVEIDQLQINSSAITSTTTNTTVSITGNGTGGVQVEEILFKDSTISSVDSSSININDGVIIDGPLTVNGEFVLNDLAVGTLNVDNLNFNDNVISSDSNADILLSPGGTGSVQASGIAIRGTTISADDSTAININESLIVDGTATVSGALSSATSLVLATGATVTGIADEDDMTSNSATLLSTQQSIKAYVDNEITSVSTTSISQGNSNVTVADSGTGNITIEVDGTDRITTLAATTTTATGHSLVIGATSTSAGGQIKFLEGTDNGTNGVTVQGPASTADVTITLPAATDTLVGKTTTDTFTNKSIDFDNNTITNIEVDNFKSGVLDTDLTSVAGTDTTLASAKSIKTYVDSQVTAQDLDLVGDSGTGEVDLDSQTLTIAGGTGLASVAGSQTVTLNIDATVATLAGSQTLTNKTLTTPLIDSFTLNTQTVQTSGTATLASSSASVLDSFASATFRSAKYMVSIKNTANSRFETAELLVVHDGTNSFIYSTGVSSTGDAMATYTTDINTGNVRILVVPQTADSTVYKFQRTLIVV